MSNLEHPISDSLCHIIIFLTWSKWSKHLSIASWKMIFLSWSRIPCMYILVYIDNNKSIWMFYFDIWINQAERKHACFMVLPIDETNEVKILCILSRLFIEINMKHDKFAFLLTTLILVIRQITYFIKMNIYKQKLACIKQFYSFFRWLNRRKP